MILNAAAIDVCELPVSWSSFQSSYVFSALYLCLLIMHCLAARWATINIRVCWIFLAVDSNQGRRPPLEEELQKLEEHTSTRSMHIYFIRPSVCIHAACLPRGDVTRKFVVAARSSKVRQICCKHCIDWSESNNNLDLAYSAVFKFSACVCIDW